MQIVQNDLNFKGGFYISRCLPKHRGFIGEYSKKGQAKVINNFAKRGGTFFVTSAKNDKKILETLNNCNASYTYYPQVVPTMIKNKSKKEVMLMLKNLIPDEDYIKRALRTIKLVIPKPIIRDYEYGMKMVINPNNKDMILFTPKNEYGVSYAKVMPGISQSKDYMDRRYAIINNATLSKQYHVDDIPAFIEKCHSTYIVEKG